MVSWTGALAPSAASVRGFSSITSVRTVMDLINTATVNLRTVWLFPQDPSRNHRAYRLTVAKLEAPIIPFMPLLIKGQSRSCDNILLTCTSKLFYCWISPTNIFNRQNNSFSLSLTCLTLFFFQTWHSHMRETRLLSTIWSILRKWWGSEGRTVGVKLCYCYYLLLADYCIRYSGLSHLLESVVLLSDLQSNKYIYKCASLALMMQSAKLLVTRVTE